MPCVVCFAADSPPWLKVRRMEHGAAIGLGSASGSKVATTHTGTYTASGHQPCIWAERLCHFAVLWPVGLHAGSQQQSVLRAARTCGRRTKKREQASRVERAECRAKQTLVPRLDRCAALRCSAIGQLPTLATWARIQTARTELVVVWSSARSLKWRLGAAARTLQARERAVKDRAGGTGGAGGCGETAPQAECG